MRNVAAPSGRRDRRHIREAVEHNLNSQLDQFDKKVTWLRQRNACLICGLPLYWDTTATDGSDGKWRQIKNLLDCDAGSMEKCHYAAHAYVPEITRPLLYEMPVQKPDPTWYDEALRPEILLELDMRALVPLIKATRINRCRTYFNLSAVRYFGGCRACNMLHTGHTQLRQLYADVYRHAESRTYLCLYRLMFDSLSHGRSTIEHSRRRLTLWNLETWITYCAIMIEAQCRRHTERCAARMAAVVEFYMSNIVGALLYANADMAVDYALLHQNFIIYLPSWAHRNGYYEPANEDFTLWKMVLRSRWVDNKLHEEAVHALLPDPGVMRALPRALARFMPLVWRIKEHWDKSPQEILAYPKPADEPVDDIRYNLSTIDDVFPDSDNYKQLSLFAARAFVYNDVQDAFGLAMDMRRHI